MSWIQKLYDTYEQCVGDPQLAKGRPPLLPVGHTTQNAHIEVDITPAGTFLDARVIAKDDAPTLIPCTEKSATRAGIDPEPYPLCDKLQYLAADFREYGGMVTKGFQKNPGEPYNSYFAHLEAWVRAKPHPKTRAVLAYLQGGTLLRDLVNHKVLPVDEQGKFLSKPVSPDHKKQFRIFEVLQPPQAPCDSFVRWNICADETPGSGTWQDVSLQKNWTAYLQEQMTTRQICMVTGRETAIATLHPAKLRHAADKAKLISANDSGGFTFRGRFTDADGLQACSVGYEVTQKAHSALRWLIGRQGNQSGTQVYVSWAVSGAPLPSAFDTIQDWAWDDGAPWVPPDAAEPISPTPDHTRDAGQSFARKLTNCMRGYRHKLGDGADVVIMGLDAATPGRMSILYYRELKGSEFLHRLEDWHATLAWPQFAPLEKKTATNKKPPWGWTAFAPSPDAIAVAAYGRRLDDKIKNLTRERLVACIVDGEPLPRDIVDCCARRAANRSALEDVEWKQTLGVACALYKGYCKRHPMTEKRREYTMGLEEERTDRDYLYGRLLALAQHLESTALYVAGENRSTTAERLMQRFADHPVSTWRTIELALTPYRQRLQANRPGYLNRMRQRLDSVYALFQSGDFERPERLSPEFLLGYHCQSQALYAHKTQQDIPEEGSHE